MDIFDNISLKIQRGNWKPYIEERQDNTLAKRRQTIQWPKEDRQTIQWPKAKRTKYKHRTSKYHT